MEHSRNSQRNSYAEEESGFPGEENTGSTSEIIQKAGSAFNNINLRELSETKSQKGSACHSVAETRAAQGTEKKKK